MNIPKLHIESTKVQIGLNIQKPIQEILQPKATLDLQQPAAILTINTTKSKLSIDSNEARANMDYKTSISRTKEIAQKSLQESLEGVARRAQEGQQLMRIENGGNPITQQAKLTGRQPYSSLNIKFIPQAGSVKINFQPATVDIQVRPQKVINNTTINRPIHNYTPGKVNIEMLRYPSLKIDWLI